MVSSRDEPVAVNTQAQPEPYRPLQPRRGNAMRLVAVNTGVQLGGRVAGAGIALVQVGILSHYLHSQGYGRYAFVLAVIGFFGMITELGVGNVGVRWLNQGEASGRVPALRAMLGARTILALLAVAASQIFALLAPMDAIERQGILLMSALYLLTIPAAVGSLFQAELEMQYLSAAVLAQIALGLVLVMALVWTHATLLPLLSVQLAVSAFGACALYIVVVRRCGLALTPSLSRGFRMVLEALPIGVITVLNVVYLRIDTILLGIIRGASDVARYTAATRFIDLATLGSTALVASIYPLLVRVSAEPGRTKLRTAYQLGVDVMVFVAVPTAVAWSILAPAMISLVYPSDFGPAVGALRVLSWVLVPLFFNQVLGAVILAVHRERTFVWISLAAALSNIALNLIFIPRFGILAASVITVVSEVLVTSAAMYLMWRVMRFVPSLHSIALSLLSALIMAVPVYLCRGYWPLAVVAGGATYLIASYGFGVWRAGQVRTWMGLIGQRAD